MPACTAKLTSPPSSVIDAISGAVFANGTLPPGVTTNEENVEAAAEELGPEIGAMENLEVYIAGKVFDVPSSVVLSFGTSTSISATTSN